LAKPREKTTLCSKLPIQIYDSDIAPKSYTILGKIHVEASSPKDVSCKMKRKANKFKGDAILEYELSIQPGIVSEWTGASLHTGTGIVVKWEESGMKRISKDTPVPVLE